MCLAVTCHLHLLQNVRDFLRAIALTLGWNGYRNNSQHRKLTVKKKIPPPLLPGLEPETFRSRVRRSTVELSPLPTNNAARLLHGWCHVILWPSGLVVCVHHTTMHQFTMSLYSKPHIYRVLCVFSCNLPPTLLAERSGSFTCYCGNTRVERIPKCESAQKVDPGEQCFSRRSFQDLNPRPFDHGESDTL